MICYSIRASGGNTNSDLYQFIYSSYVNRLIPAPFTDGADKEPWDQRYFDSQTNQGQPTNTVLYEWQFCLGGTNFRQ